MNHQVLRVTGLRLARGNGFTLAVPRLETYGARTTCLVGANGSGKSTLIEAITGMAVPQAGLITVCGDIQKAGGQVAQRRVGFIPDDDGWIIPELTATEYFRLLNHLHVKAGCHDLMARVGTLARRLSFGALDAPLGSLSHGNRKKAQIIAGLMHGPELVVADEIRNGLDPIAIREAETLLREAAEGGASVLAATHDLSWAERVADDIVMLRDGNVILNEPRETITKRHGSVEECLFALYGEGEHER